MCIRIAFPGGTGDIDEGLVLHWAYHTDHEVIVGSHDPDKVRAKVDEYEIEPSSHGRDTKINGFTNEMAVDRASVIVLAVSPYHISDTVEAVSDPLSKDGIFVTSAAGMKRDDDGFHYHPSKAGNVTAFVADVTPGDVPVIDVFRNLAADRLADLDADLDIGTLLVADNENAKEAVRLLTENIDGLRALDDGGLANAPEIEGITPLLVNVVWSSDGLYDPGTRFK